MNKINNARFFCLLCQFHTLKLARSGWHKIQQWWTCVVVERYMQKSMCVTNCTGHWASLYLFILFTISSCIFPSIYFSLKKGRRKERNWFSLSLSLPPGGFFITMILVWSIHWLCRSPSSAEEFGWPPLVSTRTQNLV